MAFKFQIVRGKSEKEPFFVRIVAANGQTLAVSETYTDKRSAKSMIESVQKNAAGAEVEDIS